MTRRINTERLMLRELTEIHLKSFHAVWSDNDATQWSPHGACETVKDSKEWMEGILRSPDQDERRSWSVFVQERTEQDDCIGIISLIPGIENDSEQGKWELGYLFRPGAWGKGFATESCSAAIDSLRDDFADREVMVGAAVDIANRKSMRVLAKLGFHFNEHRVFGGPKRFLGGDWRPHEILFFTKQLQSLESPAACETTATSVEIGR